MPALDALQALLRASWEAAVGAAFLLGVAAHLAVRTYEIDTRA
jgi:hypothetical protein